MKYVVLKEDDEHLVFYSKNIISGGSLVALKNNNIKDDVTSYSFELKYARIAVKIHKIKFPGNCRRYIIFPIKNLDKLKTNLNTTSRSLYLGE